MMTRMGRIVIETERLESRVVLGVCALGSKREGKR